jgi:hypothetical protein
MRERVAQILKIVCVGLTALLLVQLVKIAFRVNPLSGLAVPQVPSLPADTNAAPPAVAANKPPRPAGTNSPVAANSTNAAAPKKLKHSESNAAAIVAGPTATNAATSVTQGIGTNVVTSSAVADNKPATIVAREVETNAAPLVAAKVPATNNPGANLTIATLPTNTIAAGTNIVVAKLPVGTNHVASVSAKTNLTNSAIAKASVPRLPAGVMIGGLGGRGGPPPKLPPEIQARVDRVVESEILAPVMHPMPMALLGIAGKFAFLRAPSGQTGLVKEGDDLGEIKLLRIGTNRVLVEQDGQKKELMIFSGLGGESLMPKPTETSDETTKH